MNNKLRQIRDPVERFQSKYVEEPNTGCWLWVGYCDSDGYGIFTVRGRDIKAHRFSYELKKPIPEGLQLDHRCRMRCCVNPDHLEPVTCRENQRRSSISFLTINAKKTHCPKGHPYDGSNLYINSEGSRRCHECDKLRMRLRRSKLKEQADNETISS